MSTYDPTWENEPCGICTADPRFVNASLPATKDEREPDRDGPLRRETPGDYYERHRLDGVSD